MKMATMCDYEMEITKLIDDKGMSRYQLQIVLICGLIMFLDGFDTQAIAFVAPFVGEEWGLSQESLGNLFSSSLVGLMLGYLILAPMADRLGHKRMIIATMLGASGAVIASAFAENTTELMVLRFLTGIGVGGVIPSVISIASEYSPSRFRITCVLSVYVGYSIGFVFAGLVAGWLIPAYGWQSIFLVGGLATLLMVAVVYFFLPDSVVSMAQKGMKMDRIRRILLRIDPDLPKNFMSSVLAGKRNSPGGGKIPIAEIFSPQLLLGTLLLWGIFAINLGEFYALQSWLPTIFTQQGYSLDMMVIGTTTTVVGGIFAAFVIGPAMDRMSPYNVLSILYLLGFGFLLLFGFAFETSPSIVLVVGFFVGFCVSGAQKGVIALTVIFYPPHIRGAGIGWALGVGRVGAIGGPLLIGVFIEPSWPPIIVFGYMALPMLILSGTIFFLGRRYGRKAVKSGVSTL
jgi:AAHS family 4-hydroxybenzoate transporter-like MFS transporter